MPVTDSVSFLGEVPPLSPACSECAAWNVERDGLQGERDRILSLNLEQASLIEASQAHINDLNVQIVMLRSQVIVLGRRG